MIDIGIPTQLAELTQEHLDMLHRIAQAYIRLREGLHNTLDSTKRLVTGEERKPATYNVTNSPPPPTKRLEV